MAKLNKFHAHLVISAFRAGRVSNPNGAQGGREIILGQSVYFAKPAFDFVPGHRFAATLRDNEGGFSKGLSFEIPVTAESLTPHTLSLGLQVRKLRSFAQNGGPGKINLRCGVQTGGSSFSE